MVEEGDTAPTFTAAMAAPEHASGRGEYGPQEIEVFDLESALQEGPVVLAFFPGVYSGTCTQELCAFRDWRAEVGALDAQVVGVSADTPWSQLAFIDEYGLQYPLVSGFNNDVITDYDLRVPEGPLAGIAGRAVFVVDTDGTVAYKWTDEDPTVIPDVDEIEDALTSVAA